MSVLRTVCDVIWCPWLLGLVLLTGLVYSVGSGWFQIFGCRTWLGATVGSLLHPGEKRRSGGLTSVQALATALASTIGTGSIAGVATAIVLGGPGAVLWMWVCAILGMMTACGEKLLAVDSQRPDPTGGFQGGPMFCLRDQLGWRRLAVWFALACLPAGVIGGGVVQSASISSALNAAFGWDPLAVGVVVAVCAGLVMVGGVERIAGASSAMVPVMALLYLGGGGLVLICQAQALPGALALIFRCALDPAAALGGGTGYTVSLALRYGVARGVFTNEAGLGTSAMVHGAARVDHPARQGMWGIFEVFVSTLLVCTMTALVILVGGVYDPAAPEGLTGAPLTAASFAGTLGPVGSGVVAVSLLLFAFSSILGWSYYGGQGLRFLMGSDKLVPVYRGAFLFCVAAGSVWDGELVWLLVDLSSALMAFPNLLALLALSPRALRLLQNWADTKLGAGT